MNKEKLFAAGIDYDGGVYRFAGNAEIYEKYLRKFFEKNDLPALRKALEEKNYEAAFRAAHNMKGGAGNLSVTAFFNKICELVDSLREGTHDDSLLALCAEAENLYEIARKAVEEDSNG